MSRSRKLILTTWRPLLLYGVALAYLVVLLTHNLGSLPAGLSTAELQNLNAMGNWHSFLTNPFYAPHGLLLFVLQVLGVKSLLAFRSVSVLWALVCVLLFFSTLRIWFSKRVAVLGTVLLASSTWFLILARTMTPEIMQTSLVALLAVGGWLRYSRARIVPLLIGATLVAVLCYIPGMIWFILLAAMWQRRAIKSALEEAPFVVVMAATFWLILLIAPLLYGMVRNPHLLQTWAGLPTYFQGAGTMLRNAINIPSALFFRAPLKPGLWVGRLPLLDIFSAVMFMLGVYNFLFLRKLDRAKVLLGIAVLTTILITLGGQVTLTVLLPAVYIMVASGIDLLLNQWFSVFPRNPLARGLGMAIMVSLVVATCAYHITRYYRAFLLSPTTKEVYSRNL